MKTQVNDLRVASAYKKQLIDKYHLQDKEVFIRVGSKWIELETKLTIDKHEFEFSLRYENQMSTANRIIDISLYGGMFNKIPYRAQYVESPKVSEVSIMNPIELMKNMSFEMKCIESDASEWLEDPNARRYDYPNQSIEDIWVKSTVCGSICRNGFLNNKEHMAKDSEEAKELVEEVNLMVDLVNTFPSAYIQGQNNEILMGSYHLKHILERMDEWRTYKSDKPNGYYSNGSAIVLFPKYLNDRYLSEDRITNISTPNCDIKMPVSTYYFLEVLDQHIREELNRRNRVRNTEDVK